jgi:glycerol kinase
MAPDPLILAVDQGTSATKAVLVDSAGTIVAHSAAAVGLAHPRPGWVEQDADAIWDSVRAAVAGCVGDRDGAAVAAVGLSTQRESLLVWERDGGAPLGPMLSWQDQRTRSDCEVLRGRDTDGAVRRTSGLPLDPMFSALKARWLLDRYDPDRARSRRGELCLGTVDSWLLSRLGGEHVIEVGNAARTQLMDVRRRRWDDDLLAFFNVPATVLPRIVASTGPFPTTRGLAPVADGTPVAAVMGDSHAALFAHAGWRPGRVKATYGTGSSIMSLGYPGATTSPALCLTVAWDDGQPAYAFEGNIRASGATLTWLAELFGMTPDAVASAAADSSDGVHLVPGFGGLGAPWWDDDAVGLLTGLSFGTRLPQVARAGLESIAFQVEDVVAAVERESGPVEALLADGGPTANPVLMQLQADTSGRRVERALARELSALGVAHLAGYATGLWTREALEALERARQAFDPSESAESRDLRRDGWHAAVSRARSAYGGAPPAPGPGDLRAPDRLQTSSATR